MTTAPAAAEARLRAVTRQAQDRLPASSGRQALLASPITVDLVSRRRGGERDHATMLVLLDHCHGPRIYRADSIYRRRIATLQAHGLIGFCTGSPRATRLTDSGRATACKLLADMVESLLALGGGA